MSDPLGLISGSGGVRPNGLHGPAAKPRGPETTPEGSSFKELLMENLEEVNKLQTDASQAVEDLQTGQRDDVETVLAATAKADLAFRMLLQVRNKVMDSYNELKDVRV
jgi:flagellar hook-basal body complex protein FliE